jgi:transcriptional regulator with PAS, ATPase and Fis domain
VDVRIIAATNKILAEMVDAGKFREDLFFRLDVLSIVLPPLRQRKEDIPSLWITLSKDSTAKTRGRSIE